MQMKKYKIQVDTTKKNAVFCIRLKCLFMFNELSTKTKLNSQNKIRKEIWIESIILVKVIVIFVNINV